MTEEFEESPKYGVLPYSIVLGQNFSFINVDVAPTRMGVSRADVTHYTVRPHE